MMKLNWTWSVYILLGVLVAGSFRAFASKQDIDAEILKDLDFFESMSFLQGDIDPIELEESDESDD